MTTDYIINQMEVYAKIKGFENYAVSNFGNVINIKKKGKMMKQTTDEKGYNRVGLRVNGKRKHFRIHRLVAEAYLDKIEGKELVDHKDCMKNNNCVANLRWCSGSENSRNTKINSRNTSGVKAVSFCNKYKKWKTSICINNKRKHIGYFDTLEQAKIARQNKALEIFGEFIHDCEK